LKEDTDAGGGDSTDKVSTLTPKVAPKVNLSSTKTVNQGGNSSVKPEEVDTKLPRNTFSKTVKLVPKTPEAKKGAKADSKSKIELGSKSAPSDENNNNRKEDNNNRKTETPTQINGKRKRESGSTSEGPNSKKQAVTPKKPSNSTKIKLHATNSQKQSKSKKAKGSFDTTPNSQKETLNSQKETPISQRRISSQKLTPLKATGTKTEISEKFKGEKPKEPKGILKNGDGKSQSQKSKQGSQPISSGSDGSNSDSDSNSVPGGAIVKTQKMTGTDQGGGSLQLEGYSGSISDDDDDDEIARQVGLDNFSQHPTGL